MMAPVTAAATAPPERPSPAPLHALGALLDDLIALLLEIPVDVYVARPAARISGSIGGHVRHVLDHIGSLLSSDPSGVLSYDHRERGTAVETDPAAAVRRMLRLKAALAQRNADGLDAPLLVKAMVSASGDVVTGWSTFGRELAFVISHTIHHQAIVALLLAIQSVEVPERFGYAPSTPGH